MTTWHLHNDTALRGQGQLYSGSLNNPGDDTAASSNYPGPGRLSCYWGGLVVEDQAANVLRTCEFVPFVTTPGPVRQGAIGAVDRVRWASHLSWSPADGGYALCGDVMWRGQRRRELHETYGWVLHPVHVSNLNNVFVRFLTSDGLVCLGWEVDDVEHREMYAPMTLPAFDVWHSYELWHRPGGRFVFVFDGVTVFDHTCPTAPFGDGGPVGGRCDGFDTLMRNTRVYRA